MGKVISDAGRKALAALILLVAAYVLFKLVLGAVLGLLWILAALAAVAAIVWAVRLL